MLYGNGLFPGPSLRRKLEEPGEIFPELALHLEKMLHVKLGLELELITIDVWVSPGEEYWIRWGRLIKAGLRGGAVVYEEVSGVEGGFNMMKWDWHSIGVEIHVALWAGRGNPDPDSDLVRHLRIDLKEVEDSS
jgi:hypothetical protein